MDRDYLKDTDSCVSWLWVAKEDAPDQDHRVTSEAAGRPQNIVSVLQTLCDPSPKATQGGEGDI